MMSVPVSTITTGPEWLRQLVGRRLTVIKVLERVNFIYLANNANITDAEIARLNGLPNLDYLDLGKTAVTDAGLSHLSRFPNLRYLTLTKTAVTDAGLVHLNGCTLKVLDLRGTAVTDNGVEELQQTLPNCKIIH